MEPSNQAPDKPKPEKSIHEQLARHERAIQALLNASTTAGAEEAFTEESIQTLEGIVSSDDWG